jgi:hypothetical protein
LVSRRVSSLENISVLQDDLSVRNPDFVCRFDIVRAANILNRDYFDLPVLRSMLANLVSYARGPGALIVINRTHPDDTNHGTVFEISRDGVLVPVARIGRGSEVEEVVEMIGPKMA